MNTFYFTVPTREDLGLLNRDGITSYFTEVTSTKGVSFECNACKKTILNYSSLKRHLLSHVNYNENTELASTFQKGDGMQKIKCKQCCTMIEYPAAIKHIKACTGSERRPHIKKEVKTCPDSSDTQDDMHTTRARFSTKDDSEEYSKVSRKQVKQEEGSRRPSMNTGSAAEMKGNLLSFAKNISQSTPATDRSIKYSLSQIIAPYQQEQEELKRELKRAKEEYKLAIEKKDAELARKEQEVKDLNRKLEESEVAKDNAIKNMEFLVQDFTQKLDHQQRIHEQSIINQEKKNKEYDQLLKHLDLNFNGSKSDKAMESRSNYRQKGSSTLANKNMTSLFRNFNY